MAQWNTNVQLAIHTFSDNLKQALADSISSWLKAIFVAFEMNESCLYLLFSTFLQMKKEDRCLKTDFHEQDDTKYAYSRSCCLTARRRSLLFL